MTHYPYLHGRPSHVTGFSHVPPAVAGGRGFSWVLELRDFAEPDIPMQWSDPAPDVWVGPEAPFPAAPVVCLGPDCGRLLPCPDHPNRPAPEPWHPFDYSDPAYPRCDECGEERRFHP